MNRRIVPVGVVAAAAAIVALVAPTAASAAPAAPKVTVSLTFPVGAHVAYTGDEWGPGKGYTNLPVKFSWTSNGPANGVSVYQMSDAADPSRILSGSSSGSFTRTISDYDGEGGCSPCVFGGYAVLSYDSSSTVYTAKQIGSMPIVTQENGKTPVFKAGSLAYTGKWTVSKGSWADGGEQRYATAKNASVKYTEKFAAGGGIIGVIMAKGPARGSANVLVDGKKVATINTNAKANDNQLIVWSGQVGAGSHSVKIVNLATKSHGRIDIDAFVTMNLRPGLPWGLP